MVLCVMAQAADKPSTGEQHHSGQRHLWKQESAQDADSSPFHGAFDLVTFYGEAVDQPHEVLAVECQQVPA